MNNKYKFFGKNIILFSIGGVAPKILGFLMVPFYTSMLTPADYGIADLISTTVMLLVPIFTLDIQDAVMRYTLDKAVDSGDVISCAIRIFLWGGVIVIVGASFASLLPIHWLKMEYISFVVINYFAIAWGNILNMFCRGIDEVRAITISAIITTFVTIPANILFLAVFKWGITGYLTANVIGIIIADLYLMYKANLKKYFHCHISKKIAYEMIGYSMPLVFNVIAWWVNSVSDRYILAWVSGVSVSGIFAVSLKIPSILAVFQGIFYQAWSISAIKDFDKDDKDGFFSRVYSLTNAGTLIICSGLLFFNLPLSWFLYSKEFFQAWMYVPILLLAFFFNAMALFVGALFTAVKDTKSISYSTVAGAGVNIILTIVLTYLFSAFGAAISMMLGYLTVFAFRSIRVRRHIHMAINWKRDFVGYTLISVQIILACFGWKVMALQVIPLLAILFVYRQEGKMVLNAIIKKII